MHFQLKNIFKYLCCFPLTLGARLISMVGIAGSVLMLAFLFKDINDNSFEKSRKFALGLGLDWKFVHEHITVLTYDEMHSYKVVVILCMYSGLYLTTSSFLFYATITKKRALAVPWLLLESISCLLKIISLIYHLQMDITNKSFVAGSSAYLIIAAWWWLVVFGALLFWGSVNYEFSASLYERGSGDIRIMITNNVSNLTTVDSPIPYYSDVYTAI